MKEIKLDPKQTTLLAQGKENIPLFSGEKFAEKTTVPPVSSRSPEVIDLENESDTSRDKIIIPSFKKRKLEILREGGLEVTAVELEARPSVIQSNVGMSPQHHHHQHHYQQQQPSPLPATMKSTEERQPSISPYPLPVTPNSIPKLISVTVTPDIGHMLSSPQDHQNHQPPRIPAIKQLPAHHNNNNINMMNNNNVTNSRVINLGSSNNAALLQLYANANVVPSTQQPNRFVPPNIPNGRLFPPKVTQSRSIFVHNEKTVYGNPKDILVSPPKYHLSHLHSHPQQQQQRSQHPHMSSNDIGQGGAVLDLTQKSSEKLSFPRPSLEIVRVPVVQRPNPLNLDVRNSPAKDKPSDRPAVDCPKQVPFPAYQNVIDSRTIASNNLEITLVNPKHKNNHHLSIPSHVQIPSPPNKSGAIGTINSTQRRQPPPQQINGKYTVRSEPVSPYTPRKPSHPIIPNVPNLNHLNHHSASSCPRMQATTLQQQQQMNIDRRKATAEVSRDHQHRRISEGEKLSLTAQQQQQQQQQQQAQQQQPPPPTQTQPQQQSLVKSSTTLPIFSHTNQTAQQSYATYVPTSEPYNQGVYPPPMGQPTVMMAPHPTQGQAVQNGGQGDVFNQNQVYTNYAVPMHQGPIPQSGDMAELSGYFLGMNIYDQRGSGDSHSTPSHSAYPPPPPSANQTVQNVQSIQPNYWQPPPNQIPSQQTMYFVPPPGTAISVGQNPGDRQQLHQQQRFPTNYSFNAQTMTPPSQASSNYVGSYPVPYNSVPAVTPTPGDYTYQSPVQMVPTYYPPGQPAMQPPPVMYRVPTPPNTPTSSQIPGMPLMYVNSSSYAAPAMVTGGTFGHQVTHNGTSPAPPSAYMTPTLVPNLVFRQNVPVVPSVRATTPGNSQRASRSPTPAHEFFGGGSGDRSAQPQPRYPLPMYQGVHIVQGDMRLMHPGVPPNPRLQYAPVSSPPVVQGCPRPYRPPSSNTSGAGTPTSFDGRNQKIRKQRSKVTSLPPSGARPNFYQTPPMSSLSSNIPKDIREGTVKVTITRRNQVQF
ncbi:trithorax group protein osa [Monomorium pharaonis]|uniref:trithorax group protein osa n=1 Tax=Monomorium pharaonis TaxID=307658 RepID=UPI0017475356|nr:trithorax group protein osa [Monomorium pharaonis]